MRRLRLRVVAIVWTFAATVVFAAEPGPEQSATVYFDDFGIPHIYAETAEAGLYASGWLQAKDRPEQLLKNYLLGLGAYSAAFGAGAGDGNVRSDLESRMWDHYGISKKNYELLHPQLRAHLAAFVAGINGYFAEHPGDLPEWWGDRPVDVYMPVAYSRQFIWGWPAGEAARDLRRIGLSPNYDVDVRASNQMAVAPGRTTIGAAMLVIDPHLSWLGRQRYWEMRMHAGDIHISGFATTGFPYVNLGHNENVAWAHTTGGPDVADIYELTLKNDDPTQYLYDGEWRAMTARAIKLEVKGEDEPRKITFHYSHHGPIVAKQGDKAYAAALSYADEVGYLESKYYFMIARDYGDVEKALEIRQIMPQNVMVADTSGNIYYQRTGRVPIRAKGYDTSRPLDGSTSKTEWHGLHPTSDLISILNPPQGYMQNCNITPDVMMKESPMTPDKYPAYIFNQPKHLTHQRASRATELLAGNDNISPADFIEITLDKFCYQSDRWVEALAEADRAARGAWSRDALEGFIGILAWDGYQTRDSAGALKYYYWRSALLQIAGNDGARTIERKVNNYLEFFGVERERESLTRPEQGLLIEALEQGMATMRENHDSLSAVFGDVFRVGRTDAADNVSWPVGGGSLRNEGMATVRATGFGPERPDHTRWGRSGQTSTEVVIMTKPIQSFTQPPIGQSDRPDSAHYRDQARDLYSRSRMKPSWFNKEELMDGHVRSEMTIRYGGKD